jgi:hypothetical protein
MTISVASASAGDSLSTSTPTPSAPRRRGRPRKHFASEGRTAASARKAAYRARLAVKRSRNEKRALRRDIKRLISVQGGLRRKVYDAGTPKELVSIFTVPTAKEQKLINKTLAALGYGMKNGEFLTDAPRGAGQLVSGGYDGEKLSFIMEKNYAGETVELLDGRIGPLKSGRRVTPEGWSSDKDEEGGTIQSQFAKSSKKIKVGETDYTFIDKQDFPLEWEPSEADSTPVVVNKPDCHVCGAPAVAVHPDDQRKKLADARLVCDQHAGSFVDTIQ